VVIALTRTDSARAHLIKRRKLRRGTFTVRLPRAAGARYVLSARIGRRTNRRLTIVTPPATPPRSTPAGPRPPGKPLDTPVCETNPTSAAAGTLTGDRTVLRAGDTLTATFTNTGPGCLTGSVGYLIERFTDGTWQQAMPSMSTPLILVFVQPGQRSDVHFQVPDAMPAGRYRLGTWFQATAGGQTLVEVPVTWEFFILPTDGGPGGRCPYGVEARAEGALDRTTVTNGEQLALTITNQGPACMVGSASRYELYRVEDGGARTPVPVTFPDDLPDENFAYEPGVSRRLAITVPDAATMPPGHYVVRYPVWIRVSFDAVLGQFAEAAFDVVPPPD
jgi:hypothetical protein